MARILYWNINNFTNSKIGTNKRKGHDDEEWNAGPSGPQYLRMILNTLKPRDPATNNTVQLDFIVVVEIYARKGPKEGRLIGGSGRTGCINLVTEIDRNITGTWRMVPPVVTGTYGRREAIAVFYRRDRWYFLGPKTWPQEYPQNLSEWIAHRIIPNGYPYRGGQAENRSAGQYVFQITPGPMPVFPLRPVYFPSAAYRKPWLTAFGDVNNDQNLVRIMAIHTTPNDIIRHVNYANDATANLADVYDMTARPPAAPNQVDVIVGDFNVDNMVPGNFTLAGPFSRLVGNGVNPVAPAYTALVRPPAALNVMYNSYYHTHGRSSSNMPGETPAQIIQDTVAPPFWQQAGVYPGQRYSDLSIDNALVRYHNPPGPAHNTTILARARAQPYRPPTGPPPVMPMLGHYEKAAYMNSTIDETYTRLEQNPKLVTYDWNRYFREPDNYGTVYSVSDHFALLFDV